MPQQQFQHISQSPTNPRAAKIKTSFDVADLYAGPVEVVEAQAPDRALDEKLRQAYFWIVNCAILSPHYDIEYNDGPSQSFVFSNAKTKITLPSSQSYSSFVLLPILNFAVRRRCLLIGGPGRGQDCQRDTNGTARRL